MQKKNVGKLLIISLKILDLTVESVDIRKKGDPDDSGDDGDSHEVGHYSISWWRSWRRRSMRHSRLYNQVKNPVKPAIDAKRTHV